MLTQFVTVSVPLPPTPLALERAIAQALQADGEPLRWAITAVDTEQRVAVVEAVVTLATQVA